ncbi:MAG: glycoside hydrolase family 3 N-terminal domain-containing protein [Candidatus Hydrogenedentota bacterium]
MRDRLFPTRHLIVSLFFCLLLPLSTNGQQVGRGLGATQPVQAPAPQPVEIDIESPEEEVPLDPKVELEENRIESIISAMALEEKISQLMFVRLNGEFTVDPLDVELLSKVPPGGVLLPSIGYAGTAADHTKSIQVLATRTPHRIPYFIAGDGFATSDRAGADMNRFIQLPSMLSISAAGINENTKTLFGMIADDLNRLGINTHFGPSLSLSGSLENNVTGVNTFGDHSPTTAAFSSELYRAFDEHKVLWMPTGFPGGEMNRVGNQPAVMLTAGKYYIERDGLPYFMAIRDGAPMMHVGNTLAPMIDGASRPSSVSRKVITTLLRGSLDYDGLVIAGPIDSTYMLSKYEPETAAALSLTAGADMILWSRISPQILKVIALVANAVRSGEIEESLIDRAVTRVLRTKMQYGLFEPIQPTNKDVRRLQRENKKQTITYDIERQSITLLKNERNALPISREASAPLLLTGVLELEDIRRILKKDLKYVNKFEAKSAKHLGRVQDFELRRLADVAGNARTAVCIFDNQIDAKSQAEMIDIIKKSDTKVIVVLLGHPASVEAYDKADAILLTYSSSRNYGHTIQSIIDVLLGKAPIRVLSAKKPLIRRWNEDIIFNVLDVIQSPTGRLPIGLAPIYEHGDSISYRPTSIKKVRWDFGDGNDSRDEQVSHRYAGPGDFTATLTVTDVDGRVSSGTFPISIR